MFLVSDGDRENRKAIIKSTASDDGVIYVLLAAIDFEWTLRRTILALGCMPTKTLAVEMNKPEYRSLDGQARLWKKEVIGHYGVSTPSLKAVVNKGEQKLIGGAPTLYSSLKRARELRNKVVHGLQGSCGKEYAILNAEVFFAASDALVVFAQSHGRNIYKPIRRIKSAKSASQRTCIQKH